MSKPTGPVFFSRVTREFGPLTEDLRNLLQSVGVAGRTQLSFRQEPDATTTLSKLSEYIRESRAVVALVGKLSGGYPPDASLDDEIHPAPPQGSPHQTWRQLLPPGFTKLSYTQWEPVLARFWKKPLNLYFRDENCDLSFQQLPIDDLNHQQQFAAYITDTCVKQKGRAISYHNPNLRKHTSS